VLFQNIELSLYEDYLEIEVMDFQRCLTIKDHRTDCCNILSFQPADFSKRIPFPSSGVEAAAAVFQTYVETEVRGSAPNF